MLPTVTLYAETGSKNFVELLRNRIKQGILTVIEMIDNDNKLR